MIETFPGDTSLKNNNKSVSGQREIVNEEIVPTKPLNLQLKLLEKTAKKGQMLCLSNSQEMMNIIISTARQDSTQ